MTRGIDLGSAMPQPASAGPGVLPRDSAAADLAIDVADVDKLYRGRVHALRGVGMHVRRGEIFGLLGPNGAGKSTLVKILMTVIRPTRCRGHMLAAPVGHKGTLRRVGYLPEHHRFPDYLTARQVVDFFGAMAEVPRAERRRRTGDLLELVGLGAWGDKKVRSFSKGMRQRMGIAQALINDPDLILLDEPTDGVDPVGRRDIRNVLTELRRRGKTVFLNSHLLSELEMVCDRVAILVQGVVTSQGTIDELTSYGVRYEIELAEEAPHASLMERLRAGEMPRLLLNLAPAQAPSPASGNGQPASEVGINRRDSPMLAGTLPGGEAVQVEDWIIRVKTTDAAAMQPLIDALRQRGLTIRTLRLVRPTLEDLFMRAVTDPATGQVLAPGAADSSPRRGWLRRNGGGRA